MTAPDIILRTTDRHGHTGRACSHCDTDYSDCTEMIFSPGGKACCGYCYRTDTHEARPPESNMTNRELAEIIYDSGRVLADHTPMELIHRVASWGTEELMQIDPEPTARRVTKRDQLQIISELASMMYEELEEG